MIHLHVHTVYSFLDGANKIDECLDKVVSLGMRGCAITDHNHTGGWYEYNEECKKRNLKPIFGVELYQTFDTTLLTLDAKERRVLAIKDYEAANGPLPTHMLDDRGRKKKVTQKYITELISPYSYNTKQFHLLLIAMNQKGYNNIIKLQSEAAEKGLFNGRNCCDFAMLEKYSEGVICTSACLGGIIPWLLRNNETQKAEEYIQRFKDIFEDRFYLEIQPLDNEDQIELNKQLIKYSKQFNIKLVATNDVHYTNREDNHDQYMLIKSSPKSVGLGRYADEFWLRSEQEMYDAFKRQNIDQAYVYSAINETEKIYDRIEDNIKMGADKPLFPNVNLPEGYTAEQYLYLKSFKALYKYKKANPSINLIAYEKRLEEELDIICTKGFAPYILKILENVEYCESAGIPVGPGRGSAAGALTLFVNGITKVIDPIKYDLLFFRFLTKDRVDPPDYFIEIQ